MNLGDDRYFDACVYTSHAGREQLRVAALLVARAVLGYSQDLIQRRDALMFEQALEKKPGALDLCILVRKVWNLGVLARPGVDGIRVPMAQLEEVAKNVYEGNVGGGFPWGALLIFGALAGGGYLIYRYRNKPRTMAGHCRSCLAGAS